MRVFFRFDLEYTYHAHAIAKWLKRDFGLQDASFAGIVDGRLYHKFLTERQQDIRYERIGLNQDLLWRARSEPPDMAFLERVERELEVDTLWRLRDAERFIAGYNYEQTLSAMSLMLKFYEREFTEHRPDVVIGFATATMYGLACAYVARRFGIPFLEAISTRIPERWVIEDSVTGLEFGRVTARFRALLAGEDDPSLIPAATEYIDRFRASPRSPDGMRRWNDIADSRGSLHPRRALSFLKILYWYHLGHYRHDPEQLHPLRQVRDRMFISARRRMLKSSNSHETPVPGERYVYFALHLQPEGSTMILAPFWLDQLALIENIARSLPVGMRLYVKEHQPMLGFRPLSYYQRLRNIPNVRLIDPRISSLDLVRDAALIATITGTVGFEGLLFGTPVITFGDVFYNVVPCVQHCRAIGDLPEIIRRMLAKSPHDEDQVAAFVAILLDESFRMDADDLSDASKSYAAVERSEPAEIMYLAFAKALQRYGLLPEASF